MDDTILAGSITFPGGGGDPIEGYLARPERPGRFGAVVVIHHMPGYDRWTKEVTRRFAVDGYLALCPNLYSRQAPGADPDDAAAAVRALGGVSDRQLVDDVAAAADHLRGLDSSNGRVGVIGHCSGGRQSFLAACSLQLDAAVDCYGAFVVGTPPEGFPLAVTPLLPIADQLSCPLLGLFGADDTFPSPAQTAELEKALTEHGKTFEFHTYDDAGHGFFSVDRPSYRQAAAVEGWQRIDDFFGRLLSTPAGA
jgi:carboxymethylenebutenolidase